MKLHTVIFRLPALAAAGALSMLNLGCTSDMAVIEQANSFHTELQPAVVTDPVLDAYINEVGGRIVAVAREMNAQGYRPKKQSEEDSQWMFAENMRFHLVNSDTVNAFTTGGNHMYVYTQLMLEAQTEDELAAVVAHEFAHVYGRHVQSGMDRRYISLAAMAAGAGAGYALGDGDNRGTYAALGAAAGGGLGQFWGMGRTRNDEAEADQMGFDFYVRAGWDPTRFGDFFQRMIDMGYDKGNEMLSDHPSLSSRVEVAHQRAAELPPGAQQLRKPPVATPQQFQALKQRIQQSTGSMPNDKSLQFSQELLQALPRSCLTPVIMPDQKEAQADIEKKVEAAQQQQAQQQQSK